MLLSNPFRGAFGLDFGDLAIKAVQLERRSFVSRSGSKYKISEARSVTLPPGCIVNGEIQQPELVRKKILQLLGKIGGRRAISARWAVADLPETKSFLKLITIESPVLDFMYEDIAYHAKKHLPFELEETHLDWEVVARVSPSAKTAQVLVAAAPRVIADSYTYLLEAAGLNVLALEVEALSLARSLITRNKNYQGEARAILDIGATRSSLIVYDKGTLQFSTTINFSGELLTTAIAQGLKIEYEEAEQLKINNGLRYDPRRPRYLPIVAELADRLVAEIKRALAFYRAHFIDANPVTRLTLGGGGAEMNGLAAVLSQKVRLASGPGNPWKNVSAEIPEPYRQNALSYASAIGLALRAVEQPISVSHV